MTMYDEPRSTLVAVAAKGSDRKGDVSLNVNGVFLLVLLS